MVFPSHLVGSVLKAQDVRSVLLTGASGLLGTWLRRTVPAGIDVVSVAHRRCPDGATVAADLRDRDAVAVALAETRPDLVIHAAYAKDEASIVDATRHVAELASNIEASMVFISTDAVFAGDGRPRNEDEAPDPISDYGRWKAAAEVLVTTADPAAAVVRLPLVTSTDPEDHIIADIRAGLARAEPTTWFTDEWRQPGRAEELAGAIWQIVQLPTTERAGTWHLPGPERLSRAELAAHAARAIGLDPDAVVAMPTPDGPVRPRDLVLTADRARRQIGWEPSPVHR